MLPREEACSSGQPHPNPERPSVRGGGGLGKAGLQVVGNELLGKPHSEKSRAVQAIQGYKITVINHHCILLFFITPLPPPSPYSPLHSHFLSSPPSSPDPLATYKITFISFQFLLTGPSFCPRQPREYLSV